MPKVVITGFSVFSGVTANPTEAIIDSLKDWCLDGCDISKTTLVCSVEHLDQFLDNLDRNDICGSSSDDLLLVHLGVDCGATSMKLETTAYNNMTFRVPDQSGFKPELARIKDIAAFDSPLESFLDIPALCELLKTDQWNVEVSSDPGRYLCNYIYYKSLQLSSKRQEFSRTSNCQSIFIHVPGADVIPLEKQVAFVKSAVEIMIQKMAHKAR
jgi:pyroglutamyl-peptidase